MQEGGAVPKPVGGGFGSYGGTGSMFTGFESRTFINDTTGQTIIIFFFNGRPMSRIPEGFREKAATPVEEQAQQEVRDDDDDDPVVTGQDSWRNKNPSDYTLNDNDFELNLNDGLSLKTTGDFSIGSLKYDYKSFSLDEHIYYPP